jgi:hypothetical protein
LALTFYWFDRVGPRLHERDWQKFAAENNLAFEPYSVENGQEIPARVTGLYRDRQISLETFRRLNKRDSREGFFMHCQVVVKTPIGHGLALHSLSKNDAKGRSPQTGDSRFDGRFGVSESQPADLSSRIFNSAALRKRLVAFAARPIWLRLKDGSLIYQNSRSQFAGVEMDRKKLKELLDVMCELGTNIEN